MRFEDMPVLHQRVLETLTEARTTTSAVTLAADLWRGDGGAWGADPVWLVQSLLEELNEQGLVLYRMQDIGNPYVSRGHRASPYSGFATQIRLTKAGWTLMGHPNMAYQVGTRGAHTFNLDPHGDRTNFRKHSDKAEGGPVERLTYIEHRRIYDHPHDWEFFHQDSGQEETDMPRQYIKVEGEIEGTLIGYRARFPTASYQDIAEALDIPERTVRYVLNDLPRLRRMADGDEANAATQKQRVLDALEGLDFKDVPNLVKTLGRGDSTHDIVHALHDLKKQGLVMFDERGTAQKEPRNIKMTPRGRKASGVVTIFSDDNPLVGETQEAQMRRAQLEEKQAETPLELTNEDYGLDADGKSLYPELDALLAREKQRLDMDNRALRYIEAAELIRETDPETAKLLDQKAAESDIPYPSPVEAEFMRYVANHP